MTEQPVVVTQEAREAAEAARAWCDDMDEPEMVQAFARFEHEIRLSTEAEKTKAVEEAYEDAAFAARDALLDYEWPPQDGDAQIDAVMDAIRSRKSGG